MRTKLTAIGPNQDKVPVENNPTWNKHYPFKNPCFGEVRQFPMIGKRFIVQGDTESDFRTTSIVVSIDKPTFNNDNPIIRFRTFYTVYEMEWIDDKDSSTF